MTSLSTAADTQLSGLTGRKSKVNRNLAIVSQIPAMREIAASNSARKKQEKQDQQARTLSEEQAGIAKSQANKSAAVQGATTLGQAAYLTKDAWLPAAKGALGIGESVANPALSAAATEAVLSSAPISATQSAAPMTGAISTAVPESAAMVEAAPGLVEAATAPLNVAPEAASMATPAASLGVLKTPLSAVVPQTAGTSLGSTTLASAAGPAAIVAGAEIVKKLAGGKSMEWGNKNNDWDEKTVVQQMTSAPGTAGGVVPFIPGAIFDKNGIGGKVVKEMANIERLAMKPISWLLGDK